MLLAASPAAWTQPAHASYTDIAPIFQQKCVMCHAGPSPAAGLRLDSLEAVLKGSAKGPVVKTGAPDASELVRRIKGISQPRMPMTGPPFLSEGEVATIERWIAGGLQRGDPAVAPAPVAAAPLRPRPGEKVRYPHVAPILATRCAKCHAADGLMGPAPEGFVLTSHRSTLAAIDRARVVPGHPEASELVRRIRGQARPRMPLDGPPFLSPEETRLIEDWIAQGAADAAGVAAPIPRGAAVRLHGTLGADGRLDELPLLAGPRTRVDKSPAPGSYVEVRGRIDDAGRIIVERMRQRRPAR
jgi:uncharacterized membrane protein